MQIQGPAHVHGPQPINAPHAVEAAAPAETHSAVSVTDEVQISEAGRFVDQVNSLPDVRAGRVDEIRASLAQGTYDIESRMELAVERLLDEIA